jgi:hypothetical protein
MLKQLEKQKPMRSSKSRSRNKSSRNNRSVGNVVNRVFDSSGPEGKVRGTPQQIIEKYNQLARDAQLSGDRVATETFQQHAEHYTRMLAAAQKEQDARRDQHEAQQQSSGNNNQRNEGSHNGGQNGSQNTGHHGAQQSQQGGQNTGGQQSGGNQRQARPQPEMAADTPDDSGLVETPEARGTGPSESAPRKPRKATVKQPKPAQDDQPDAATQVFEPSSPAESAEQDDKPARKPRTRAKAKAPVEDTTVPQNDTSAAE